MPKPSNEKIERHYFENFSKFYAVPDGCVAYGDKPDVVILGERKLGIEITNFFVQAGDDLSSEQRQRPLREKLIADAHRLFLAAGGKKFELSFGFDKDNPIISARMQTLSKDIAAFAQSHNQSSGEIQRHLFRGTMPELWSIYVNAREYDDAKWRVIQVHKIELMSKNDLEVIVREKESKSEHYEVCDAYWLLVVVDGIDAAQEQEIRIDGSCIASNVFEKIIVFHTFGHFVEILPSK
jgi:hypothetical protein